MQLWQCTVLWLATLTAPALSQQNAPTLFDSYPDLEFPELTRASLQILLAVEDAYWQGDYLGAYELCHQFWQKYPASSPPWNSTASPTAEIFLGTPSCYSALRMWSEITDWKVRSLSKERVTSQVLQWTIVVVGLGEGPEPKRMIDLERGKGELVERKLDRRVLANKQQILHQSTQLFREYAKAISGGRIEVKLEIISRPSLRVDLQVGNQPRTAGLADGALGLVWKSLSDKVLQKTDWWWVIYPSHVPEQYDDFKNAEFITGGMASGPDGASPCFIIDDRWLLRKPPHLGSGPWHEEERRAYLPQWLQHEFFHYLFRIYPQFELEKRGHQWFDLATWPDDFKGHFEADYYHEAIKKRLADATPPLHIGMRHAAPPAKLFRNLSTDDLVGHYRRIPAENDWHVGTISPSGSIEKGENVLLWRNAAGKTWLLREDLKRGYLRTGEDNPYFESADSPIRDFRVVLRRDENGNYLPKVAGIQFNGGFYALSKP
jgi:hypothetical protein